jgi:hypothetical protein
MRIENASDASGLLGDEQALLKAAVLIGDVARRALISDPGMKGGGIESCGGG